MIKILLLLLIIAIIYIVDFFIEIDTEIKWYIKKLEKLYGEENKNGD
jgi:hypothetical protein